MPGSDCRDFEELLNLSISAPRPSLLMSTIHTSDKENTLLSMRPATPGIRASRPSGRVLHALYKFLQFHTIHSLYRDFWMHDTVLRIPLLLAGDPIFRNLPSSLWRYLGLFVSTGDRIQWQGRRTTLHLGIWSIINVNRWSTK